MAPPTRPLLRPCALLVDRDQDTRDLYAQYLRAANYDVDEADDGRVALAKTISRHFDVIVTDTRLPGMDGYALARLVRRDAGTRQARIVIVTGETYPANLERACRAGADVVLTKPCSPEALLAELQHLLDRVTDVREPVSSAAGGVLRSKTVQPVSDDARQARTLSRAHQRGETTAPPVAPPELICPACDRPLIYQRSQIGGVSARHPEQWDYYECPVGCGTFQYRQRTRRLRRA